MNSIVQRILAHVYKPSQRLFPHDARYLRRAFSKAVKEASLTPFRFHDLRHTFASRLAMQGGERPHDHGAWRAEVSVDASSLYSSISHQIFGKR
jgi:integrase